jgi:putative ATPase
VPLHLRNPVTPLMEEMGYGKDYKYAHDYPGHVVEQQHLPDSLKGKRFYTPGEVGYEKQVQDRMKAWFPKKAKPEETEGPAAGGEAKE